jgi:arsenate reductase
VAGIKVYGYAKCSTCRRALQWLHDHNVAHETVDIVQQPPSVEQLRQTLKSGVPVKRLFNTSGVSYREGRYSARLPTMSDDEAIESLAADGKLIKRPLVLFDDGAPALVGFDAVAYGARFDNRS